MGWPSPAKKRHTLAFGFALALSSLVDFVQLIGLLDIFTAEQVDCAIMGATAWHQPLFPVVGDLLVQLCQKLKLLLLQLPDQGSIHSFHHTLIVEQVDAQEVQASLRPGTVYLVQLLLAILAMVVLRCLCPYPFCTSGWPPATPSG